MTDKVHRALLTLKDIPFSGKDEDYPDWAMSVKAELGCLEHFHFCNKIDVDAYNKDSAAYLKSAKIVFCLLFKWIDKSLKPMVRSLPYFNSGHVLKSSSSKTETEADKPIATDLMEYPHPSFLWNRLKEKYEGESAVHLQLLVSQLCQHKMEQDFDLYVAELDRIFWRLSGMGELLSDKLKKAFLVCGIPDTARQFASILEEDGSKKTYEATRSALVSFFSKEQARESRDCPSATGALLASKRGAGKPLPNKDPDSGPICSHCKKSKARRSWRHSEEDCFLKHPEKETEYLAKKTQEMKKRLEELSDKDNKSLLTFHDGPGKLIPMQFTL